METLKNTTPLQWMIIFLSVNSAIAGASAQLTDLFGPHIAHYIVSAFTFANILIGAFMVPFTGQTAMVKSVLAMPGVERLTVNANSNPTLATIAVDPNVDKIAPKAEDLAKVIKIAQGAAVLLIFIMSTALLIPSGAQARAKAHRQSEPTIVMQVGGQTDPIRSFNDKIKKDLATQAIAHVQDQNNPASNALQQLSDFISGDVANASDLAISIPDLLDGNGQICLDEMKKASIVFQANPVPTITDKQGIASALERIRLLAMEANRICQNPSCTQVFADASGALAQLAPLKMPAVPNLHDICSLIPTVAVAKPTRSLPNPTASPVSATPTPSPSPSSTP